MFFEILVCVYLFVGFLFVDAFVIVGIDYAGAKFLKIFVLSASTSLNLVFT